MLGAIDGTGFADWPITYADLEPYYTKVEWEIGVSGLAGVSPFDPPRTKPYPMPPLPVKSSGVLLERGARKLGLHPFPAPMAINSQLYRGRPACQHCGFCHGFGCEVRRSRRRCHHDCRKAEATGRCEIRPGQLCRARRDRPAGRATGVAYFDAQKRLQLQRAKAVVLCANGAETPRLLLNSESSRFPHGLANSSGVVGKHLMFNTYFGVNAQFEHPLNEYKSVQNTRMVLDFYDTDPNGGDSTAAAASMPGSGNTRSSSRSAADRRWIANMGRRLPRSTLRRQLHAHDVLADGHGTSLPLEANSVTLDPSLKDAWGLPCMRVTYKDHPDDLKNAEFLTSHAMQIAQAAGALKAWPEPIQPQTQSVHLLGTCRMGNDPRTSVIDRYHRTHDVRNLFICDGSSMVTSSRASRPRPSRRSPSGRASTSRHSQSGGEI